LQTYQPFIEQLIAAGHAYYCWCSPERLSQLREEQNQRKQATTGYDRLCLGKTAEQRAELPGFSAKPVVRMKIDDDAPLVFEDLIRGSVAAPFPDDQVICKADGFPTYHLAVVVDDHLMGITHVIRGEEWISSTPKHLLLYRWLGWQAPIYAHMPLLRDTDRSKISKRKNPAARLTWFREQGYLPQALRNFLQLLGYPPADNGSEIATFDDFAAGFDWDKVGKVGPIFDIAKLNWLNGHYIRSLPFDELAQCISEYLIFTGTWPKQPPAADLEKLRAATPLIAQRLVLLSEALPKLAFLFTADADLTIADDAAATFTAEAPAILASSHQVLSQLPTWDAASLEAALRAALVDQAGHKARIACGAVRTAITGQRVSPPLFESIELLGRQSCLQRLDQCIRWLDSAHAVPDC
jgi:glutamyl-tRNA synthetase